MEKIKRRYVPFKELSPLSKRQRAGVVSAEILMSVVALAAMIYWLSIGDPYNRLMNCINTAIFGVVPIIVERIVKYRFSFGQHIVYLSMMVLGSLIGSCFYVFDTTRFYDLVIHCASGYLLCVIIVGLLAMGIKNYRQCSPIFMAFVIFWFCLGTASLWEITEFTMDVLFSQNGQGFASAEVMQKIEEMGLTGLKAGMYKMRFVSVLDTDTDMSVHFIGTMLFVVHYLIETLTKRRFIMERIIDDATDNRMNTSVVFSSQDSTPTTTLSETETLNKIADDTSVKDATILTDNNINEEDNN